ncbi:hypothetical protein JG688_00012602 [Phytophthora aleatoria]|uniref:Uncharacterized protein n=1 Tax=Phytophthora aleatoria TaxID=2496075 RepID=A0A8J5IF01_9STRA|nr:hypothetical protein JG688_00012602 [Phytophthora aleatoria]
MSGETRIRKQSVGSALAKSALCCAQAHSEPRQLRYFGVTAMTPVRPSSVCERVAKCRYSDPKSTVITVIVLPQLTPY